MLTTGKLNAALGFYEPGAARQLGIPRDRINHNSLLSAVANLKQPAWGLAALNLPATPTARQIDAPIPAIKTPAQSEYQAAASKLANSNQQGALPSGNSKADKNRQKRLRQKLHHQMQQQQAMHNAPACDLASANPVPFSVEAEPTADAYASLDTRRKRCIAVADRGSFPADVQQLLHGISQLLHGLNMLVYILVCILQFFI